MRLVGGKTGSDQQIQERRRRRKEWPTQLDVIRNRKKMDEMDEAKQARASVEELNSRDPIAWDLSLLRRATPS
jgi:hypothetical protein